MWTAESAVAELKRRGELWSPGPGMTGLRGSALQLLGALERRIGALARAEAEQEWRVPAGIPLEVLVRADYFASFPQWLTLASHLSDDPAGLERVAAAADPAAAARESLSPAGAALPPAVCYHAYGALAGSVVASPTLLTAQGTCWRHEGDRLRSLERDWAFTMREVVCLGTAEAVEAFRRRGVERARELAASLGLEADVEAATDPFFAPTARGKELLQRLKALKHELTVPIGGGRRLAVASFNHHEAFFGEAFDIRLAGGAPAASGCVAFGLERWLLAYLVAHGPDPRRWPDPELEPLAEDLPCPF